MNKEQMMDTIINQLGFEHSWTVWFCTIADKLTEEELSKAFFLIESSIATDLEI